MSLAHKLSAERERRLARMAARAVPDHGINLPREILGWRGPPSARPREPELPPPPPAPAPAPPPPAPEPEPVVLWPEGRAHQIMRAVCERFAISSEDIRRNSRAAQTVMARQICMTLLRELTNLSFAKVGRLLGKDHTTVVHAVKRMTHLRTTDPAIAALFRELIEQLGGVPMQHVAHRRSDEINRLSIAAERLRETAEEFEEMAAGYKDKAAQLRHEAAANRAAAAALDGRDE